MKKVIAMLVVLCLLQTAAAGPFEFMKTPYKYLDIMIMPIWKPLVNLVLISWAQSIICGPQVTLIMDTVGIKYS